MLVNLSFIFGALWIVAGANPSVNEPHVLVERVIGKLLIIHSNGLGDTTI